MDTNELEIQPAKANDLGSINQIISTAVMSWDLPERVKRLVLPSYYYTDVDLQFLKIYVIIMHDKIIAVLAIDHHLINSQDKDILLIHGMYVHPGMQNCGVGRYLFKQAEQLAKSKQANTLQVKAQKDAEGFFMRMGMKKINCENNDNDYRHQYRKAII